MTSVFMSYARADAASVVPFAEELRAAGFEVWLDQTSIVASVPWRTEIGKAIRSSHLIVVMGSPAWLSSQNCAEELALARQLGQPVVTIDMAVDRRSWMSMVLAANSQISEASRIRSALLGDSIRWDQAGRPTSQLVTGQLLRDYGSVLRSTSDVTAHNYVRTSIRRRRRRRLIVALTVLITLVLYLGGRVAEAMEETVDAKIAELHAAFKSDQAVNEMLSSDIAEGLSLAIAEASAVDSSPSRSALGRALQIHLPTEVTRVGEPQPAPSLVEGDVVEESGRHLTIVPGGVEIGGTDRLKVVLNDSVTAVAWSPDGSRVAAATPGGVVVIDIQSGRQVDLLRGFDGAINDLEWDEGEIIGRAGESIARWSVSRTAVIGSFEGSLSALVFGPGGKALAIGDEGGLSLWDGELFTAVDDIAQANDVPVAAATDEGWIVFWADRDAQGWMAEISRDGSLGPTTALGACEPRRAVSGGGAAHLVCWDRILEIELSSGRVDVIQRLSDGLFQPDAVVYDADGSVLATSVYSSVVRWTGKEWQEVGRTASGCTQGFSVLAPSPDRTQILFTGHSVAGMCTELRTNPENRADLHRLAVPAGVQVFRGADWSPSGRFFAAAAASGEVWLFDSDYYVTADLISTGERLIGVTFIDSNTLVAATRDGDVISIDITAAAAEFEDQLIEAERRLVLARDSSVSR